jgi:transposase
MDATGARDLGAVVLGLGGFRLVAVDEHDGELELAVETTTDMVGCPGCGAVAAAHGRRPVRVRDLPVAGRPTTLIWLKRLWRCRHQRCETRTWSETSDEIPPRASVSTRAAQEACRRVGQAGESVAAVATDLGLGWGTVMRAVACHGSPLVDDPARLEGVAALGVDETAYLAATASHGTEFATGLVDLTRTGGPARLLDVVPGRSGVVLAAWLRERDLGWRAGVVWARWTRSAGTPRRCAPSCRTRCACWTRSTSRGSGSTRSTRSAAGSSRRPSAPRAGHPSDLSWTRLLRGLDAGDPDGQVAAAWIAAQELRLLYRRRLAYCADSEVPELHRLARTLDPWRDELLAHFTVAGVSN